MQLISIKSVDEINTEEAFLEGLAQVDMERKERVLGIKNPEEQKRSLAAGLALMDVLNQARISRNKQSIRRDSSGKLYLPDCPELYINLSHSGAYGIAVLSDQKVGVDIEDLRRMKRRVRLDAVANRCFSSDEMKEFLAAKDEEEKLLIFAELWTRKEALVKAKGIGIQCDLTQEDTTRVGTYKTEKLNHEYIYTICEIGD